MPGAKLHLIATPLGNRGDITLRAIEQLKSLSFFFAEDSREFFKLLELYAIPNDGKRVHSYAAHNMKEATETALGWLREGKDIGFVSDRGTPAISDPGARLVDKARTEGFEVIPIPGPSAVVSLLSVSGFPTDRFVFLGFLPSALGERTTTLDSIRVLGLPFCFYESPKRARATLEELKPMFPGARVFVGREMTKMYETYLRFPLEELDAQDLPDRGEYTIAVEPGAVLRLTAAEWEEEIRLRLAPDKEWAKAVAARAGIASSEVYNALQRAKNARA